MSIAEDERKRDVEGADLKALEAHTNNLPKHSESAEPPVPEQPYSIFTPFEKWLIVSIASIASVFR